MTERERGRACEWRASSKKKKKKKAVSLTKESSSSVHLSSWMFRSQSAETIHSSSIRPKTNKIKIKKGALLSTNGCTGSHFCCNNIEKKWFSFFFKRKETDPFGKEGQRNEKCTFCCRASIMAPFSGFCSAVVLRYFLRKTKTKCKIYFRQFFLFFFFFIEAVLHSSTKVLVEVFFFV